MWFMCTVSSSHINVVCKLYSQVFAAAVGGSECPVVTDDCPACLLAKAGPLQRPPGLPLCGTQLGGQSVFTALEKKKKRHPVCPWLEAVCSVCSLSIIKPINESITQ